MRSPVTIRPPFGARAKAAMARSISAASRTLTGLTSTPSDGAAAWIAPNWPIPPIWPDRKDRHACHAGRDLLEQLQPFPAMPNSNAVKPVALPPGRARLVDEAGADRVGDADEHDRHGAGRLHSGRMRRRQQPG